MGANLMDRVAVKYSTILLSLFLTSFTTQFAYSQEVGPYVGAEYCKKCHPAIYDIWNTSPHSNAYAILKEWNESHGGFAASFCFDCHVTSLKDNVLDVSCEVCHGPKDSMIIDTTSRFCGRCHIEAQKDLAGGAHARTLICTDCHDSHITRIITNSSSVLCSICHTQTYKSFFDGTHHSNEVECVDCHMKRKNIVDEHTPNFDHRFYPQTDLCFDCHDPHIVRSLLELDNNYSTELSMLQEDVEDLRYVDYAKNLLVVTLLVIMVILVVLLVLFRRRRQI